MWFDLKVDGLQHQKTTSASSPVNYKLESEPSWAHTLPKWPVEA